jgi:hypothetical protein
MAGRQALTCIVSWGRARYVASHTAQGAFVKSIHIVDASGYKGVL